MWSRFAAVVVAAAACKVPAVDFTGKACPCPSGYACDTATNTCARGATGSDARGDAPADGAVDAGPRSYYQAVLADSPLAYWRLGDTSTTAKDELGNNPGAYSGTCTEGETGAIAGDPNTAVLFDGSTCEITLPDALAFLGTAPYSVEAWIDEATATSMYGVIFSKESRNAAGPIDGYGLVDSANGVYLERAVNSVVPTTPDQMHALNVWIHLVGVYDGAKMVLYIDGQPIATIADTRVTPMYSADAVIGADLSSDHFKGMIDEVAVYDHALTAAHVQLHYDLGTGASGGGD